ncbi:Integrase catalytic domain-containing protein [Citrus sinensis]|nr:Integrase catalytic domain-containing protein [Citrus sinensis]
MSCVSTDQILYSSTSESTATSSYPYFSLGRTKVVVDHLTKSAHFESLPPQFTAVKTADLFVDMVIKIHGFPTSIISYRSPVFLSNFWKKLFELSGTTLRHSTAYHPQTDGQSKVVNRGLEQYLCAFTQEKPSSWVSLLGWAEFSYNSSYHSSIKMSPFQALFGRPPLSIPPYLKGSTSIQAIDEALSERDALLHSLKENFRRAQHCIIQKANAHRCEAQFAVGDQVLVKLQPYHQTTVATRSCQKLAKRSKIHQMFHISLLKPFIGSQNPAPHSLPSTSMHNQAIYLPAAVCAIQTVLKQGKQCRQVLVQWQDNSPENSTWEEFETFCKLYPDFHLEDKVSFEDGGNDTTFHIQPNNESNYE